MKAGTFESLARGSEGDYPGILLGEELAHVHAADIAADGAEFAAKFGGSIRFHVVGIEMTRSAAEANHDDRFSGAIGGERAVCFQFKQIGQRETSYRE